MRRKSKACSRRLIEDLPACGGFVINVAGSLPPVLKLFVADNQEIEGDIERANEAIEAIEADHLRESVGGLFLHDHDIEVAICRAASLLA